MKTFAAIFVFALLLSTAAAQSFPSNLSQPTRSQSGQFLAFGVPGALGPPVRSYYLRNNFALVDLEPWVLVVSCERIKQTLWRELNVTSPSRGKIFLFLHRAQSADDSIIITPRLLAEGWSYRVDLPDIVDRNRYLSALTHVLLLELANRNAGERPAEIPLWLREGLARQVLIPQQLELIPAIPEKNVNGLIISRLSVEGRHTNSLTHAHAVLQANPALTFQELSFPSENDLRGERGEEFSSSAQLFVARLLGMKDGGNLLRRMVESLPQYYNWQFAFLRAFHNQFSRLLEVEKWWAINVVQFTGHDLVQTWPEDESRRRLDTIVRPAVEVRTEADQLPLRTDTTLQTIIRDWDKQQQTLALTQIITELATLKIRLAPGLIELADGYQTALSAYLRSREEFDQKSGQRSKVGEASFVRQALMALNALDDKRAALQPRSKPFADAKTQSMTRLSP